MVRIRNVESGLWLKIIEQMLDNGWILTYKYDLFDAGIDYDLLKMKKGRSRIVFEWDNWDEGNFKCSKQTLSEIERLTELKFFTAMKD
jgi:hypothetical protein